MKECEIDEAIFEQPICHCATSRQASYAVRRLGIESAVAMVKVITDRGMASLE